MGLKFLHKVESFAQRRVEGPQFVHLRMISFPSPPPITLCAHLVVSLMAISLLPYCELRRETRFILRQNRDINVFHVN